jgi:glycerate 2-kinase
MADSYTIASAKARGVDLERALEEHKVTAALISLEDVIFTGQTGTNVNDLKFIILM